MMVPLSEAVARRVPSLFRARHDKGDLCASMTLMASSFWVSKMRTSPVVGGTCVLEGGAWDGGLKEDGGALWGKG